MSQHGRIAIDDCWNKIGVHGDASCPKLDLHIHCRNCPVFMRAAIELLDRPVPVDYMLEQTTHVSLPQPTVEAGAITSLVFRLGSEWLALPATVCREVTANLRAHTIPSRQNGLVLGLVNVRGELVISVSLDRLLGIMSDAETTSGRERLIIIEKQNNRFAFPALEVSNLRSVAASQIQAVPATLASSTEHYVRGIFSHDEHNVGLIDDELLFYALNKSLA